MAFPGRTDDVDVGAWEMVAHRLAVDAGINIAEGHVDKLGKRQHTFMTKRFDRVNEHGERKRLHFASAMTMLGRTDGSSHEEGVSYLELVEFLMQHGADVDADLLNISENDNSLDLDLAREVAGYFRVDEQQADEIIEQVISSVRRWGDVADSLDIAKGEQEQMQPAFRVT